MMKDIQEKRIENELSLIQESPIPNKFKKIDRDEYQIDVKIPTNKIEELKDEKNYEQEIRFIILMGPNYPFNQPKVYCKSEVKSCIKPGNSPASK